MMGQSETLRISWDHIYYTLFWRCTTAVLCLLPAAATSAIMPSHKKYVLSWAKPAYFGFSSSRITYWAPLEMAGTRQNSPKKKKTKHRWNFTECFHHAKWCTGGCWFTLAPGIVVLTNKCSQTQKELLNSFPVCFFFFFLFSFLAFSGLLVMFWTYYELICICMGPFVQIIVCFYVHVPCIISHTRPFRFRMCFQKTNAEI